ncbi:MAG: flagellin [Burkholderiaceae bacterium]
MSASRTASTRSDDLERFQVSRASIGHQLNAADRADEEIARGEVGAKERMGELVDVDLAEAISAMSQRQTQLDAAMQTYVKMSGLSLFDYLR